MSNEGEVPQVQQQLQKTIKLMLQPTNEVNSYSFNLQFVGVHTLDDIIRLNGQFIKVDIQFLPQNNDE